MRPFVIVDANEEPVNGENGNSSSSGTKRYRSREKVDEIKLREVRAEQALNECRSFVRRFNDLDTFAAVVEAMREVLKTNGVAL